MEATGRDQRNHIISEGLRLVSQCKVPPFCSSIESDQLHQVQLEWAKSLLQTLPPLLDWIEQHRNTLFDGEECGLATLQFQRCFVLVFLEQGTNCRIKQFQQIPLIDMNGFKLVHRLLEFEEDVVRMLAKDKNTRLRSTLFHYYEIALRLQGWQCRSVEVYSFFQLILFLRSHPEDILPWQGLMLFAVNIAKQMLGFQQSLKHPKEGIRLMWFIMELPDSERSYSEVAEEIVKMALRLTRPLANTYLHDYIFYVIYRSLRSISDDNPSLDNKVMQNLLTLPIVEPSSVLELGVASSYLRTLTLLLLLDVPEVVVKRFNFEEITISGRQCDWHELFSYTRNHLQNVDPDDLRFSVDTRVRIGRLIPELFSTSFFKDYILSEQSGLGLDLLTWVTMFPIGQTEQQKHALGLMLKRLLNKIKRLCKDVVEDRSQHPIGMLLEHYLNQMFQTLRDLLPIISEGINELPALGQFRKMKWDLKKRMTATRIELKRFNTLVIGEDAEDYDDDDEEEEEQDP